MNGPNDELKPASDAGKELRRSPRGRAFQLIVLGLTVTALLGMGLAYLIQYNAPQTKQTETAGEGIPARLFPGWGKPDLVVVLSAQQHGYMMPCGCSSPQIGGLERRYNFIQRLKAKGWPIVAVDLGDVPQKRGIAHLYNVQGLIKYRYSMMALKEMGYLAVGIGEYEAGGSWSLARIEGEWAANSAQPAILAANLKNEDNQFPFIKESETQTVPGTNIKVGVTNIVGPTVIDSIKDPAVNFRGTMESLPQQLKRMSAEKVDLPILLYHGQATGRHEAIRCAKQFPQIPIVLALSEEDEPPSHPDSVDHPEKGTYNYVFRLGHKGKHIGVVGVYRNGPNFNFKYQLVEMSEEFKTREDKLADQPIMKMMEEYTRELKSKDYLKQYGQVKHTLQAVDPVPGLRNPGDGTPHYVGSEACKKCHEHAYDVWKNSPHSHAYDTLVNAKHPSLRQYDGECIVCHTIGFGYKTGYTNETEKKHLRNVGCESCHGPGSLHAKNPESQQWRELMNQPWLAGRKNGNEKLKNSQIEKLCVTCHDIDNDVNWVHKNNKDPFHEKWINGKIIHNNPPEKE